MKQDQEKLENKVSHAWLKADAHTQPTFEETWQAAERRYATSRRRHRGLTAAAGLAVAAIVATALLTPTADEVTYVEAAELLGSTSWSAPSDVLLPEYQFDIYQELPSLIESTEPAGGSLL
jgi:hypothetical protein